MTAYAVVKKFFDASILREVHVTTQKCRFMEKREREISRFFVAPRRESAPAVCKLCLLKSVTIFYSRTS